MHNAWTSDIAAAIEELENYNYNEREEEQYENNTF